MIKFFRNLPRRQAGIRQKMLTENKPASPVGRFSKYMLYAIGEIVLVVIGILIALSLNNSNEQRVINESINSYLTALKEETHNNIEGLNFFMERIDMDIANTILAVTELNKENADQLADSTLYRLIAISVHPPHFTGNLNRSVYDDLINSGLLKNIKDQEFKQRIFLIGARLDYFKSDFVNANNTWTEYLMPYQMQNFIILKDFDSIRSEKLPKLNFDINRKAYIHNLYFTNQLGAKLVTYQNTVNNMENHAKGLSELVDLINSYTQDLNP
jgi:hypothetical protein